MTRHVVMFSGGGGSWATARRVAERHGRENLTLLFADTLFEDQDLYRFLIEAAADVLGIHLPRQFVPKVEHFPAWTDRPAYKLFVDGLRCEARAMLPGLEWISRGLDVWDVFFKERFLGNSSVDPCSKLLKRQLCDAWLCDHCDPTDTTCYVGIDFTEKHRFDDGKGGGVRPRRAAQGWTYEAPLCEPPWVSPWDVRYLMREAGIRLPRLYGMGYPHNNCGGFCVKSGHAGMALLLRTQPDRYAFAEGEEIRIRDFLDADVTILTDRSGDGKKKPLTLTRFRERLEADAQCGLGLEDWGGCGCFTGDVETAA